MSCLMFSKSGDMFIKSELRGPNISELHIVIIYTFSVTCVLASQFDHIQHAVDMDHYSKSHST